MERTGLCMGCHQNMTNEDLWSQVNSKENGCPPTVNTPDEARWAYMRWIHMDYGPRSRMPAADAVLGMLPDMFPCQ